MTTIIHTILDNASEVLDGVQVERVGRPVFGGDTGDLVFLQEFEGFLGSMAPCTVLLQPKILAFELVFYEGEKRFVQDVNMALCIEIVGIRVEIGLPTIADGCPAKAT